jgi:paraquat-inducible protein A
VISADAAGLVACHDCGLVSPWHEPPTGRHAACPRCHGWLHRRKPDSVRRTLALLAAATLLYVPANVLPVMTVVRAGHTETTTILGGTRVLFETGQPAVAALVLFASIVVPVVKVSGLLWMVLAASCRSPARLRDRAALYRLIELFGRWSMLDIFMISILIALVKLGALVTIEVEPGAIWFAAVVVLTMLATAAWDPRLAWDAVEGSA